MTAAYDESTRAALDDVCNDLAVTIGGEHDGHLLPRRAVQALYAFLSDLRDIHDEGSAIDVELWPTLTGLCDAMLQSKVPADHDGVGKPCDRPGCRAPHNWTGGRCLGNSAVPVVVNVGDLADEVRAALRGAP